VYALVEIDPSESFTAANHPIASMIHNGLLVAQGNYKEQTSLKDFLQAEMGVSLDDGLEEFIDKLDGLEGALDPQKLKDKLKNLDDLKDFIPTPAKIVPFHSEKDILEQPGDIFYVGRFQNVANANLSVNSFPILYQARYREQEIDMIRNEIEHIISQVETNTTPEATIATPEINIQDKINKEFIPALLYTRKDAFNFENAVKKFKYFLTGYPYPDDVEKIIGIIKKSDSFTKLHDAIIEQYAKKINEVCKENFSSVEKIKKEIELLEKQLTDK
jgi:hypothetical protein